MAKEAQGGARVLYLFPQCHELWGPNGGTHLGVGWEHEVQDPHARVSRHGR